MSCHSEREKVKCGVDRASLLALPSQFIQFVTLFLSATKITQAIIQIFQVLLDDLVGGQQCCWNACSDRNEESMLVCWLSSVNTTSEQCSLVSIWQISDSFLTKRINYFSSLTQTRTFQTLLHYTSLKPPWVKPFQITRYICWAYSCLEQISLWS